MPVEINLSLCLPRDGASVPVVRHICGFSLGEVGVETDCREAIELALTEACTNVLDHSEADDSYEVHLGIDDERCTIRVKDLGHGFDHESLANSTADPTAESGRGIALMNMLVDTVKFVSKPEVGMVVHLEKSLEYDDAHPVRRRFLEQVGAAG